MHTCLQIPYSYYSAAEKLVLRSRQFVGMQKEDGFTALHLAALNGHRQVAETLITLGRATVDITNNKKQTPLLLAVSQVCTLNEYYSSAWMFVLNIF